MVALAVPQVIATAGCLPLTFTVSRPSDQLRANRQSSVHANSFMQILHINMQVYKRTHFDRFLLQSTLDSEICEPVCYGNSRIMHFLFHCCLGFVV